MSEVVVHAEMPQDVERSELQTGFAGVFTAIGSILLISGLKALLAAGTPGVIGEMVFLLVALGAMFLLRRVGHRFAALIFAVSFGVTLWMAVCMLVQQTGPSSMRPYMLKPGAIVIASAVLGFSAALAYVLVRVPFLVFFIPGSVLIGITTSFLSGSGETDGGGWFTLWIAFGVGVISLIAAVLMDLRDRNRTGDLNQAAFWVYFAGAPLTVHPLMIVFFRSAPADLIWLPVLVVCFLMTVLGLVMDRRGPVVSTIVYVTGLVVYVLAKLGTGTMSLADAAISFLALPLVIVGAYVIVLGVCWYPIRRAVLAQLTEKVRNRLPSNPVVRGRVRA